MGERSDAYLIVKRGLYYRPKACGYTGIRDYAGRYSLEEVAVHFPNRESESQDGMSFIHEDDAPEFTVACFDDLRADHLQKQRDALAAEVLQLREVLRPFADVAERDIGDDEADSDAFRPMQFLNHAPKLTVGDLRRARAALTGGQSNG